MRAGIGAGSTNAPALGSRRYARPKGLEPPNLLIRSGDPARSTLLRADSGPSVRRKGVTYPLVRAVDGGDELGRGWRSGRAC